MGSYLNPGSKGFQESLNSEIYVDKTGLIEKTNAVLNTRQKFLCVSRPRRFGKSMAADMLAAYYDRGEDSAPLFHSLKISNAASYQQHLNQYDTFCTRFCENETNLKVIQEIMGHADISTTMDVYAEATQEKKKASMTALQSALLIR